MIAKSILLFIATATFVHCQVAPSTTKWCASTLTGQSELTPYCKSVSYDPEMADSCSQSEVLGYQQHLYMITNQDMDKCFTVALQYQVAPTSTWKETYIFRGPLVGDFGSYVKSCPEYCKSLRQSHEWLQQEYGLKVTPLYVSCLPNTNDEDLTSIAGVDAKPLTNWDCSTDDKYAKDGDGNRLPKATNPEASAPGPVTTPAVNTQTVAGEGGSLPGWYLMSLGVQLAALVVSLGLCIYGVVLYAGFKSNAISPSSMEMQ